MDAPPVNRLLQLLRQRRSDAPEPSHVNPHHVSTGELSSQSPPQSDIQPATRSDIPEPHKSDTQPITKSDILSARQSNTQAVPKGSRQPARSDTQPITK